MNLFRVKLKKVVDESYDIEIGAQLAEKLVSDIANGLVGGVKKFVIITDDIVKPLYADTIKELLVRAGYQVDMIAFANGEKSKVRAVKEKIEDEMLFKGYRRDCCVIAVGGGVVSDMAGFVAGTFARGVPFINYATTLLAGADASIGGKVAVDTDLATNLIGLFYQPKKVYIDIACWQTLSKELLSCGLAETIKHACLADKRFFHYLEKNIPLVFEKNQEVCQYIAEKNAQIKYKVVMKDERESAYREVLNLGHTVGRAIETVSEYRLLHGQAVAIGLVAEVKLAHILGFCSSKDEKRVIALLEKAKLPVKIPDYIDKNILLEKLYTDKKVKNSQLRFVLQEGIGKIKCFENEQYALVVDKETIKEIIEKM